MKNHTNIIGTKNVVSRRDVVQKLAGLGFAAGAAAVALSPQKAQAAADNGYGTISAIRGGPTNIVNNAVAVVLGHSAPYDGGGGLFYWDSASTESDNDATIVQISGVAIGRWKRAIAEPVNVKWFGATGNGSTDDTAAIQNAINLAANQANAGAGSACVLFPEGKYCVNTLPANGARLALPNGYSGKIHLCGIGDAILYTNGANPNNLANDVLLTATSPYYLDILIENLTFRRAAVPSATSSAQTLAIYLNGQPGTILRPIIRNCIFQDFSMAVYLVATEGALVTGCRWKYSNGYACGRNGTGGLPNVGLWCSGGIQTQIVDNYWVSVS
jgi:pectate lyase-like protein